MGMAAEVLVKHIAHLLRCQSVSLHLHEYGQPQKFCGQSGYVFFRPSAKRLSLRREKSLLASQFSRFSRRYRVAT
jgi:hypothetical protein